MAIVLEDIRFMSRRAHEAMMILVIETIFHYSGTAVLLILLTVHRIQEI